MLISRRKEALSDLRGVKIYLDDANSMLMHSGIPVSLACARELSSECSGHAVTRFSPNLL